MCFLLCNCSFAMSFLIEFYTTEAKFSVKNLQKILYKNIDNITHINVENCILLSKERNKNTGECVWRHNEVTRNCAHLFDIK